MSSSPLSSERLLSLLCSTLDLLPDPVFVVDRTGHVIGWNRHLELLSGISSEEMEGKNGTGCGVPFYGDERPVLVDHLLPVSSRPDMSLYAVLEEDDRSIYAEVYLPSIRGGAGGQVIAKAAVVMDPSGAVIGGIESLTDISTQRRSIEGLLTASANLNKVNRLVRHDIMNELTIVLGYIDLASESVSDAGVQGDLARAAHGAQQIQQRIEFTREVRNHGATLPLWHKLGDTVTAALHETQSCVPSVTVRDGTVQVFGDPLFLRVIITLLASTCQRGGNSIELWTEDQGDHLRIIYTDNGEGIPAREKERIFDGNYSDKSGYGLFFDREILAVTGITLQETGNPDDGARFEFVVPAGMFRDLNLP